MKKHILMIIAIGLIFGAMFASVQTVYAAGEPEGCIAFTSSEEFSVSLGNSETGKTWDGTVQVSTNGSDWEEYTAGNIITAVGSDDVYSVFFRGKGNSHIISDYVQETHFQLTGEEISCSGNIENLLDHTVVQENKHPEMSKYAFYKLFQDCKSLIEAPELPATTLADYCYYYMFSGCEGLTAAPVLPATTLAWNCYDHMFESCTSLNAAPELPATTLAIYCYSSMFEGCTGLTKAPELPAETMALWCYGNMFSRCTGLKDAPKLPATTLGNYCYYGMFKGCTGLTEAPNLPATTLADKCYFYMFSGCEGLTAAPELPATTLADNCYGRIFESCTSLTEAPELPATTLDNGCYYYMFKGCTGLETAPELPATTLDIGCYSSMFSGCTGLETAPELPATTLALNCYDHMFESCTSLNAAPELLAKTLAEGCYYYMFKGCTSLIMPPALPATTLTKACYYEMFRGSGVRLSIEKGIIDNVFYGIPYRIPEAGDGAGADSALKDMFSDTGGPFKGTPDLNTTYYLAVPGSGTEEDPYVISDVRVWNALADIVESGYSTEGLYFKLGKDIEVTSMVGADGKPFSGNFDGAGYTLTFNADEAPLGCAPFAYTKDAVFRNLHITGTIKTNKKYAAGLIGFSDGTTKVINCRSSVIIDSSVDGDGSHGGFIAKVEINGSVEFEGCVFDGKLLGPETTSCGGFIGWASGTDKTDTVKNCLFAPEELTIKSEWFPFIRNAPASTAISNCYYTKNIGDNSQGKTGRTITADEGITLSSETAKYDVSGITAHETGLVYEASSNERVYYAGKDDKISVTIQSACDEITANAGTLVRDGTAFTLTMPDENVTLTLSKGTNHRWKFTGFTWTGDEENGYTEVVANYNCENDPVHTDTIKKVSLDQKMTEPNCTTGGKTTFTAAVAFADSLDGKDHSESRDAIATNAIGHDWGEVTYTWSADNSEVKAEHACTREGCSTTEEETVAVTSEVTKPQTCVEKGETTYTPGEFKNKAFKAQAKTLEDVPATGHTWKAATCTDPKTCTVCNATEGEALGHAWGAWTPLDENQHQRVCENDSAHTEEADHAWDEGVVNREATTEETGEKLFTCRVCGATRTEVIPIDDTPVDPDIPVIDTAELKTVGNFVRKEMKIFFQADEAVTNYQIQYRMAGETEWQVGWSDGANTYTFHNLKKASLCEFRIAGFVALEDGSWVRGEWSNISYRYMRAVKLKSAKAGKKRIALKWAKDKKGSGYQIKYFTNKNIHMADADTITIKGKKKTKYTIKQLQKGQTYYVRIRPIKIKDGIEYQGILKNTKKAKVK